MGNTPLTIAYTPSTYTPFAPHKIREQEYNNVLGVPGSGVGRHPDKCLGGLQVHIPACVLVDPLQYQKKTDAVMKTDRVRGTCMKRPAYPAVPIEGEV